MSGDNHNQADREAVIQQMMAKGHTRERAEATVDLIAKTLFGPGGRFEHRGEVSS